ncbi:hypothetical protein Q31b_14380 [Novipirellula aureliae]|uniref:BioF2-like acetyltransferase domain-containing protein n=1 Tax=Novipirellula aureliae TaxID=2527966 RepID=A0A5C6E8W8_9BACT|nr:GNAT family N-acetyltransferase [Novipirellula aureliae]TWU43906.1 hypothetical protein Q31b_14380 [Novipirellula aureliae]
MFSIERTDHLATIVSGADSSRELWNSLADGVPFREPSWLESWWESFSNGQEPYILIARDASRQICGLLPLYRKSGSPRVLCSFGNNNVCSDFVSVIAKPENAKEIAKAMANFLIDQMNDSNDSWDLIEMDGISENDEVMKTFAAELGKRSAIVHAQSRMHTWLFECQATWDDWLQKLSRRTRRKHHLLESRVEDTDGMELVVASNHDEVTALIDGLIDLHQRRWNAVGEPGSYADPKMRSFIQQVAKHWHDRNRLHLVAILMDGKTIGNALNYRSDDGCLYVYSTGYDIEASKLEPGRVLTTKTLKYAHEQKMKGVEFLRGDEAYKKMLGAVPTRLLEYRIVAPRLWAKLSHAAWATQFELKQWVRRRTGRETLEVVDIASSSVSPRR